MGIFDPYKMDAVHTPANLDADKWDELIAATYKVADIVKESVQPELAPPFYDSRSLVIPANEVFELFGYDASRIRFYAHMTLGSGATAVQIGNKDQVEANLGYPLATTPSAELHTVEAVYVKSIGGPATVYLWVEYRKR